jgi:hypothetical protein
VKFWVGNLTLGTVTMQQQVAGQVSTQRRVVTPWSFTSAMNIAQTLEVLGVHNATTADHIVISDAVIATASQWPQVDLSQTDSSGQPFSEVIRPIVDAVNSADGGGHTLPSPDAVTTALTPAFSCNYSGLYTGSFAADKFVGLGLKDGPTVPTSGSTALVVTTADGIVAAGFTYQEIETDGAGAQYNVIPTRTLTGLVPDSAPSFDASLGQQETAHGVFTSMGSVTGGWKDDAILRQFLVINASFDGVSDASPDAHYRFADVAAPYYYRIEINGDPPAQSFTFHAVRLDRSDSHNIFFTGPVADNGYFSVSDGSYLVTGVLDHQVDPVSQRPIVVLGGGLTDLAPGAFNTVPYQTQGCSPINLP